VWVLEPVLLVAMIDSAFDQSRMLQSDDEKSPRIFK